MDRKEAIEKRFSCRTFDPAPMSRERIGEITARIDRINAASGLTLAFVEDGGAAFAGFRRSYGMFKNVRSLILMKGPSELPDLAEKLGYYGAELILELTALGLGTCWVGGTFDRGALSVPAGETLLLAVPVGEPGEILFKDRLLLRRLHGKRKPAKERLTAAGDVPAWLRRGMEAVVPAPSAVNSQKPHFTYADGVLTAAVPGNHPLELVDLGIAKKHFELGAGGRFALGNGGTYARDE